MEQHRTLPRRSYWLVALIAVVPAAIFLALRLQPELDPILDVPFFHFYIVSFTSLVALVTASYIFLEVTEEAVEPIFLTLGFAMMGGIFFVHGISTPNVLMGFNVAVGWSAQLSLTIGAVYCVLALLHYQTQVRQQIVTHRLTIALVTLVVFGIYVLLIFNFPEPFESLNELPVVDSIFAYGTVVLLLGGTYESWERYRKTPNRLYLTLTVALVWLALAQISQFHAPLWRASWWLYHAFMLAAYTITMVTLVASYERSRSFQLTWYFGTLAVIVGVPLVFLLGETTTRLTERYDLRWTFFAIYGTALLLFVFTLYTVVTRAQRIMDERAAAIEREKQWHTDMTNLIAHDLKNPLNAIFMDLYLIQQDTSSAPHKERLDRIQHNANSMVTLIENMLDVERMQADKLNLSWQDIHVTKLLDTLVSNMQSTASIQSITLETDYPEQLPTLHADENILTRIIQNLLTNAFKYTPNEGKVQVEAKADPHYIQICIHDTGPGVPPDKRSSIFEYFGQIDTADQRRGYGLGLAFCKLAVEQHGGTIAVDDSPLGGSQFSIQLPQKNGLPSQ